MCARVYARASSYGAETAGRVVQYKHHCTLATG